jgi:hypothetical protein
MMKWPYTKGMHDLGNGSYAYLQPDGTWGYSNSGLVVDGGKADQLPVPALFDGMARYHNERKARTDKVRR